MKLILYQFYRNNCQYNIFGDTITKTDLWIHEVVKIIIPFNKPIIGYPDIKLVTFRDYLVVLVNYCHKSILYIYKDDVIVYTYETLIGKQSYTLQFGDKVGFMIRGDSLDNCQITTVEFKPFNVKHYSNIRYQGSHIQNKYIRREPQCRGCRSSPYQCNLCQHDNFVINEDFTKTKILIADYHNEIIFKKGVPYFRGKYVKGRFIGLIGNKVYSYSKRKVYCNNVVIYYSSAIINLVILYYDYCKIYAESQPTIFYY